MKNKLLQGTLILTAAGLLSRIMGFLYKIYLAGAMSEERMGLYQLIVPVSSICFTIYASGIQTAVSKRVAEVSAEASPETRRLQRRILTVGMLLSVSLALLLSLLVSVFAGTIADRLLEAPETAASLKILSIMFPFCGATACLNGYYYGKKRSGVPAGTQLLEQAVRISFVMLGGSLMPSLFPDASGEVSCELAAMGVVVGEIASNLVSFLFLLLPEKKERRQPATDKPLRSASDGQPTLSADTQLPPQLAPILQIAVPLTANHLVLSLLHSYETILIPALLRRSGMPAAEALGELGVVSGMVMPFLFFPTAITSALAILLLPTVSEAHAAGKLPLLQVTVRVTLRYTFLLGVLVTGIFVLFGDPLCLLVFGNARAGAYLSLFAFLCPFLYASQTAASIVNGLSKTNLTFRNSVVSCILRLLLQLLLIPRMQLPGYLIASLSGTLLQLVLDLSLLKKEGVLRLDVRNSLIRPVLATLVLLPFFWPLRRLLTVRSVQNLLLLFLFCACYSALFLLLQGWQRRRHAKRRFSVTSQNAGRRQV
ncbi:MAG: oligosaccharide flippase family protein [Lachnospiraceae bacterium]|nr:oligosaccharide flippase family protein [Lachnospiraceae bacterium]